MSHSPQGLLNRIQHQNTKLQLLSRQRHRDQDHSQEHSQSDLSRHEAKSQRAVPQPYQPYYSRRMSKPKSIGEIDIGLFESNQGGDNGIKHKSVPKKHKIDHYLQEKFSQIKQQKQEELSPVAPHTDRPNNRKDNLFRIKNTQQPKNHSVVNPQAAPPPPPKALTLSDIESINLHQLLSHLQAITPPELHSPAQHILAYFESIHQLLGTPLPSNPTIKKYHTAIYYGHKSTPNAPATPAMLYHFSHTFYYGMLSGGKKHGIGVEVDLAQRHIWKGKYQHGHRTGYFYHQTRQSKYYGMVSEGLYHGEGHLMDKQSEYKGSFSQGVKEGHGWEKFKDKREYKGDYFQGRFDGQGELKAPSYYYKGIWKEGRPDGSGFERTSDYQYLGEFELGRKEGKGILKTKDGASIEGYFSRGLLVQEKQRQPASKPGRSRGKPLSPFLSKNLQQLHEESDEGTIENMIREIKSYPIQQQPTGYLP